MKIDLLNFSGYFLKRDSDLKATYPLSDSIIAVPTSHLLKGEIWGPDAKKREEVFFLKKEKKVKERKVYFKKEETVHIIPNRKDQVGDKDTKQPAYQITRDMVPVSCWKLLSPRSDSYPLLTGVNEHITVTTRKLKELAKVLLPSDCFSTENVMDFAHWHLDYQSLPYRHTYTCPRTTVSLQILSVVLEKEIYSPYPRNDQRKILLTGLRDNFRMSDQSGHLQHELIYTFINDAASTETLLFDLSEHSEVKASIKYHHDEILGYLVPNELCQLGRNSVSLLPSANFNMMKALRYCLTIDTFCDICIDHVTQIMMQLGFPQVFCNHSEVSIPLQDGEFSPATLGRLMTQSIIENDQESERDDIMDFMEAQEIQSRIIFSLHKDVEDAKVFMEDLGRSLSIKFLLPEKQVIIRCDTPHTQRREETNRIFNDFNHEARRIKNNHKLSANGKKTQLRKLVILTVRLILFCQPFKKGNSEMVTMLHILLCRKVDIPYVKLNPLNYIAFSINELYEKEIEQLAAATRSVEQFTSRQQNPLIPFIKSNCLTVIKSIAESFPYLCLEPHLGIPPAAYACLYSSQPEIIQILLQKSGDKLKGATIHPETSDHTIFLELLASQYIEQEKPELLSFIKENIPMIGNVGYSLLEIEAKDNKYDNLFKLLELLEND